MELVAQGIANIGSAIFGGITVTGTVARTATNVRSGARSPLAGIFHAVFIVLFMLVAAPLASYIPLAALAGVLAVVAWNMVEKPAIVALLRTSPGDVVVLLVSFVLTVFVGLTQGIVVGFALGALIFIHRMARTAAVELHMPPVAEDEADELHGAPYDPAMGSDPAIAVYRISGAFFFGAAASVAAVLERITDRHQAFILDFSAVPFIDSTAANAIEGIARRAARTGVLLLISGASPATEATLATHGVGTPKVAHFKTIEAAFAAARAALAPD
jgi:SulP family sulfate permease